MLPSLCGPMLPWALFPFKVLPSILNAYSKSSGVIPPKRYHSEQPPPKQWRSGLPTPRCEPDMNDSCPSLRLYSFRRLPRQHLAPKRWVPPACRPVGQPALEFFERPLMHFPNPHCRLRWNPTMLFLVLQRPFQVEVALISRVFRAPDRSPLTDYISSSATFETGSNSVEVTSCSRHRHSLYASTHRMC